MKKRPKRGSEPLGSAGDLARLVSRLQSGPGRGVLKFSLQHTWVKYGEQVMGDRLCNIEGALVLLEKKKERGIIKFS